MDLTRFLKWSHFSIDDALPGSAWGTGGIGLADLDGDGGLDVATSRRETLTAYWCERKDDAHWDRHTVGLAESLERALGAAALDIDGDGDLDIIAKVRNADGPNYHLDLWRNDILRY